MKRIILVFLFLSATLTMAQRLHEETPARYFEEAFVIGNGTLGGIIYSTPGSDRISLNDITLWTGEPESQEIDSMMCAKVLATIREALEREDYRTANNLQRGLQGHYSENYQPLGSLGIGQELAGEVEDYHRWLDVSTAVAGMSYKVGSRHYSTEYFCSCPDQVMVVRVRSNAPLKLALKLESQLPTTVSCQDNEIVMEGYAAYHSLPHYLNAKEPLLYDPDRGIHFQTIVRIAGADSVGLTADSNIMVQGGREIVLLIANATSFNGFDKDPVREGADYRRLVRERIDAAASKPYAQLLSCHTEDYRSLYGRVEIDLGTTPRSIAKLPTSVQLKRYTELNECNPDLEELYFQFGRYLLISSSRTPGVPANLQGLWNEQLLPPWSSNYTCNINLEENYWPAEVANLSELHMPLLTFLKNLQQNGQPVARRMYGVQEGWCSAHNSDIWAMANPVGAGKGDPAWANWNMGAAWLTTHIWEHYLFTHDIAFLHQYYPVLRGAAEFCMGWLVEKDGYLLTMPSTSPENKFLMPNDYVGPTFYGGTADRAMIRECLLDASYATLVLRLDDAFVQRCDSVINRLVPYKIGFDGNLLEWYHDWEDAELDHRHQSHLYGLYPGHSITPADTELVEACRTTLALRGTETTGWSTGWRINLYARMGDGEMAYQTFRRLLRYVSPDGYQGADAVRGGGTYPNLLDAHSPFQIDGNFGGLAGICEMLVQSSCAVAPAAGGYWLNGRNRYLPALPSAWQNGHVKGLRIRSGETVEIKWKKGKIKKFRVEFE